jgi:hypothetical protein
VDPDTRRTIERILAEQAQQAGHSEDLGSIERIAPRERAPELWDLPPTNAEVLPANLWRYAMTPPQNWGDVTWDRDLTMERMLEERGVTGWRNLLGQVGLGIAEPGASEFTAGLRGLSSMAATVPRELMEAFGRAVEKKNAFYRSTVAHDPPLSPIRTAYHGSPRAYGDPEPSPYGDHGAGYYFTGHADTGSDYAEGMTRATRNLPDATPNVRAFYPAGRFMDLSHDRILVDPNQGRKILDAVGRNPILSDPEFPLPDTLLRDLPTGNVSETGLYQEMLRRYIAHYNVHRGRQLMIEYEDRLSRVSDDMPTDAVMDWYETELSRVPGHARNALNEYLHSLGYDGLWDGFEGVAFDPKRSLIAPWDAEGMLRFIERVSPDEADGLRGIVDRWMEPVGGP